ncbi:MAG: hypothetical protein ACI9XK_000186 [Granulosicoccus sp.]|jgi:hypothetical protein
MQITFYKLTLFTLLLFAVAACGSGQSANTTSTLLEDEVVEVVTKYDGAYQTFCGTSVFAPISNTAVTVTTIDGAKGLINIYNYLDKGCTLPAYPSQTIMGVSIAYPGKTIETDRGIADFVDITVESVILDGQSPSLIQQQQLASSSILGTRYDIILLQDSALYTGESTEVLTGTTAATRATTLSSHPSIEQ